MRIGIVGWGVEGQSAYRFFGSDHDYLIVNEHPRDDFPTESGKIKLQYINAEREPGLTGNVQDLSYLNGIDSCDKIIYSVTNAKNLEKKFGNDKVFWSKATTTQHIFFQQVKTENIIGITGTKGKGTTATLIYDMINAADKKAFLGGNIGTPVLDFVAKVQPGNWVILELSNFQLYNLTYSPRIAVCLMVVPEHMDWHPDMADYTDAKANLFRHQKPDDIAIYFADNEFSKKIAGASPGQKLPYYKKPGAFVRDDGKIVIGEDETEIIDKTEVKLLGEHNLQNVCAALTAVYKAVGALDKAKEVLSSFSGLEHRLELVRELGGIKYYDDSFAATPDATTASLSAIPGSKVMIMGGFDRQLPLDDFSRKILENKNDIRKIVLIGQSADRVAKCLAKVDFDNFVISNEKSISAILSQAIEFAQTGDSIVLSPGFPSFDMFKNFEVRGQEFKAAVNSL